MDFACYTTTRLFLNAAKNNDVFGVAMLSFPMRNDVNEVHDDRTQ